MSRSRLLVPCSLAVLLSVSACDPDDGPYLGQHGSSGEPDCVDDRSDVEPEMAAGTYGLVAADVAAATAGTYQEELFWVPDESKSTLTVEVDVVPSNARWVESRVNPDAKNPNAGLCVDRLEYDVDVRVMSDDGKLQETWTVTARAEGPESNIATLVYRPESGDFQGSFDAPSDAKSLEFTATVQPQAPGGVSALRGNLVGFNGGKGTEIAFWPPGLQ